jgi:hypothetical protein
MGVVASIKFELFWSNISNGGTVGPYNTACAMIVLSSKYCINRALSKYSKCCLNHARVDVFAIGGGEPQYCINTGTGYGTRSS